MGQLSDAAIAKYAVKAGFSGNGLVMAVAIALAESGGETQAQNVNRNRQGAPTSIDRGLWQINNVYHKEVSDACAYDPACAAGAAYKISNSGNNWSQWSTFKSGVYRAYASRALSAAQSVNTISGTALAQTPPTPAGAPSSASPLTYQASLLTASQVQDVAYQVEGDPNADILSAYRWILAIALMFGAIYLIAKTRVGYAAVYYAQVLILFFVFVTQAGFFREALSPLTRMTQPKSA